MIFVFCLNANVVTSVCLHHDWQWGYMKFSCDNLLRYWMHQLSQNSLSDTTPVQTGYFPVFSSYQEPTVRNCLHHLIFLTISTWNFPFAPLSQKEDYNKQVQVSNTKEQLSCGGATRWARVRACCTTAPPHLRLIIVWQGADVHALFHALSHQKGAISLKISGAL